MECGQPLHGARPEGRAGRSPGVRNDAAVARGPGDLEGAFEAARRERASGLITLEDPFTVMHRARIVELALRHRLPPISAERIFVHDGGLMAYGPILAENFRRGVTIPPVLLLRADRLIE